MPVRSHHQQTQCPRCRSTDLYNQGLDQICLDCDWTNSSFLVELGQLDHPFTAAIEQFVCPSSFEDLAKRESQEEQTQSKPAVHRAQRASS